MKKRLILICALLLPILVLAGNTWLHYQQRESGDEVILPISGFDPRDLLSGHYLIYQVNYGIGEDNGCPTSHIEALACLAPERRIFPSDELPASCTLFIRGNCNDDAQFVTGLERFYVPEQHAKLLEKYVQDNDGELVVSVDNNGDTAIRDLLITGKPWKEVIGVE